MLLIEAWLLLLLLCEDALLLGDVLLLLLVVGVGGEELEGQVDGLVPQPWTCKTDIVKYCNNRHIEIVTVQGVISKIHQQYVVLVACSPTNTT